MRSSYLKVAVYLVDCHLSSAVPSTRLDVRVQCPVCGPVITLFMIIIIHNKSAIS